MRNKIIRIAIALIALIIIAVFALTGMRSSLFTVENNEDGSISVTAQKAADESGGMGYISIAEGQELKVRSNLTDDSSVTIEVLPKEVDATTKVLMEESFTGIDSRYFELPEGEYSIRVTAEKGAEGTMDISAE